MACRGVHFAMTGDEAARFVALVPGDGAALMALVADIENAWDEDWLVETDKAWAAIHRCLTDGKLEWGPTVAHLAVLGPEDCYPGDSYIVNFVDAAGVKQVAALLPSIERAAFRAKYDAIDAAEYVHKSDEDFAYTWDNFEDLRALFVKAAKAGRAVLFTVDQ